MPGLGPFTSVIVENLNRYLAVSYPQGPKLPEGFSWKNQKIGVYFWRAEDAGYRLGADQRDTNWGQVSDWEQRSSEPGFRWLSEEEQGPNAIIVGEDGTIIAGQHRILGGLMSGNPVPRGSISWLPGEYPSRPWSW